MASFEVHVQRHAPAAERKPLYDAWQLEVQRQLRQSPPSCQSLLQSARGMWVMMAVQVSGVLPPLPLASCELKAELKAEPGGAPCDVL